MLLLLCGCAQSLPAPIEYRAQSLPATAFDLPPMPVPPVIDGPLCRPESRSMCLSAAAYVINLEAVTQACYGRMDWVRGQVDVYGLAAE